MSEDRGIARQYLHTFAFALARVVSHGLVIVILGRALTLEEYGVYALIATAIPVGVTAVGLELYAYLAREIPGPYDPNEMQRFLETFMYDAAAFLVDEVVRLDRAEREVEAILETTRFLPLTSYQRVQRGHPAHVCGGDIIMVTACLGSMHAWFFHGARWDEGWTGFGNRIHRAEFRKLADVGPPIALKSRETNSRIGTRRMVLRYEFEFRQGGDTVYHGDQSAMFVKEKF